MKQIEKLKIVNNLSYFDKNTLSQIVDISDNSLYANIKRWLKKGELVQLKRGLYVMRDYLLSEPNKTEYSEFIANRLREPSYLSTEYVLQKYGILTEAIFSYTSISIKPKRTYLNNLGTFTYRTIKEELFTGFKINQKGNYRIKEASKAKALFDYLYLKTFRIKNVDKDFVESLRLNLNEFAKEDIKEFTSYCNLLKTEKIGELPFIIKEML